MTTIGPGAPPILVLDDDKVVLDLIRDALLKAGHQVHAAGNVATAREHLQTAKPILVLCDIHLNEEVSGIDLLHEYRIHAPDIAMVMITGDRDIQMAIDCLRDGAFDYIVKPFAIRDLQAVVARALARQEKTITERTRIQEQLRILGQFPAENPYPVLRVSTTGILLYANAASSVMLRRFDWRIGHPLSEFLRQFIADTVEKGMRSDLELPVDDRIFSFVVTPIPNADYLYLYGHDITNLKNAERELIRLRDQARELSLHDPLTGLPNRLLLTDRLHQGIARAERNGTKLAVVFVDLDSFKQVNDSEGHRSGDEILVAMAQRLAGTVRQVDTVARWGGDEMILLLPDINEHSEARLICERVRNAARMEIAGSDGAFTVTLSMGIAIFPDDARSAEQLLQNADAALYRAKSQGRNAITLFDEGNDLAPDPRI